MRNLAIRGAALCMILGLLAGSAGAWYPGGVVVEFGTSVT